MTILAILFDVRETSINGIILNAVFFPLQFIVLLIVSLLSWKVKSYNPMLSFIFAVFVSLHVLFNILYFTKRSNYRSILNEGLAQIEEGKISDLKVGVKSQITFRINEAHFRIYGSGVTTPAFNDVDLMNELFLDKTILRVSHFQGNILKIETLNETTK